MRTRVLIRARVLTNISKETPDFEGAAKTAAIADQVVTAIKERVTAAAGQPVTGSIPIPELGLTAMLHDAGPVSAPGLRVTYDPPQTDEQRKYHWKMAALRAAEHRRAGRVTAGLSGPGAD
jgi:hypothetical protein